MAEPARRKTGRNVKTYVSTSCANRFRWQRSDGLSHPGFAPAGGIPVTFTTTDAAGLPLPPTQAMPQGAATAVFVIGYAAIDDPTVVSATATYNGLTVQQTVTVNPPVPLTLLPLGGVYLQGGALFEVSLNRPNFLPAVVSLASSHPVVAPRPSTRSLRPTASSRAPTRRLFGATPEGQSLLPRKAHRRRHVAHHRSDAPRDSSRDPERHPQLKRADQRPAPRTLVMLCTAN